MSYPTSKIKRLTALTAVALMALCLGWGTAIADPALIAEGKGIRITTDDAEMIRQYSEIQGYKISQKRAQELAVRLTLFAKEAEAMGLTPKKDISDPVERLKHLANQYQLKLLDEYQYPAVVIESYYWAHPEQFRYGDDTPKAGELMPLDDPIKEKIRRHIVDWNQQKIWDEAYQSLLDKYGVRILQEDRS